MEIRSTFNIRMLRSLRLIRSILCIGMMIYGFLSMQSYAQQLTICNGGAASPQCNQGGCGPKNCCIIYNNDNAGPPLCCPWGTAVLPDSPTPPGPNGCTPVSCSSNQFNCGNTCCDAGTQFCDNGNCKSCPPNQIFKDGKCTPCPTGATVKDGQCACSITGATIKDGQCVCPTGATVQNGACTCPTDATVQNGQCVCPTGATVKDGQCACSIAGATIKDGQCVCPTGATVQNDSCICPTGATVQNGACTCPTGATVQNGACTCPTDATVQNGACTCPTGELECESQCIDLEFMACNNDGTIHCKKTSGVQTLPCGPLGKKRCYNPNTYICVNNHIQACSYGKFGVSTYNNQCIQWRCRGNADCEGSFSGPNCCFTPQTGAQCSFNSGSACASLPSTQGAQAPFKKAPSVKPKGSIKPTQTRPQESTEKQEKQRLEHEKQEKLKQEKQQEQQKEAQQKEFIQKEEQQKQEEELKQKQLQEQKLEQEKLEQQKQLKKKEEPK